MVKISQSEVEHVAKLAKLALSEEEVKKYSSQMSSVIDFISELSEVNTEGVEPTSQTTGLENVWRPDEAKPENCLSQDQAVSGTDKIHNGYFKVGAILAERSDK